MPKPILTRHEWDAVRDTAVALGDIRAACEQHGVSYAAARQRAARERWPVATRLAPAVRAARETLRKAEQEHSADVSHRMSRPVTVTPAVTPVSTADAVVRALAEDGRSTKAALSQYARRASRRAAELEPDEALGRARQVAQVTSVAAQVHGWDRERPTGANPFGFLLTIQQMPHTEPEKAIEGCVVSGE